MRYSFLLLLMACAYDPTGVSMAPPAIYRQWYAEVEACSGLRGDFDRIQWQHAYDMRSGGTMYVGYWYPQHTITIRDDFRDSVRLVKHEEMHDLLQRGDHPPEYFTGVCGNLIVN